MELLIQNFDTALSSRLTRSGTGYNRFSFLVSFNWVSQHISRRLDNVSVTGAIKKMTQVLSHKML